MVNSTTKIRFWGGLKTIGGTIVTIEYNGSRVIFDFGLVYDPATNIFDGKLKTRKTALVKDQLSIGTIPKIDGIYSKEDIEDFPNLVCAEESEVNTAVIISHLHLDHIGAMGFLSSSIPIYYSEDSKRLYEALYTIGEGVPGDKGRTYQSCRFGQSFNVGEIQVTPIPINHDIPGSCGFHIQTPDGSIVYTGDLRFHGKYPEVTKAFMEQVKDLGLDVLITEGTSLRAPEDLPDEALIPSSELPEDMLTEQTIPEKLTTIFEETKGLAIFNPYHRNIDRLAGLIDAAHRAGRTPVFEPETAYLVDTFLAEKEFLVYLSRDTVKEIEESRVAGWKKTILGKRESVTSVEINKMPSDYVLQNAYENSLELFDLNVVNGIYIHSNGVPLGPFDPAYSNLDRILSLLDLEKINLMAGGHAVPSNLSYFVHGIDPSILVPLHSFFPERLKPRSGRQLLPEYGVTYELKNHDIKAIDVVN